VIAFKERLRPQRDISVRKVRHFRASVSYRDKDGAEREETFSARGLGLLLGDVPRRFLCSSDPETPGLRAADGGRLKSSAKEKAPAVEPRGKGNQYSSGRRMQVEERSASVMIQTFVPPRSPVAGEEALAGGARRVVCGRIFRANVAPITSRVAHEIGQVVFLGVGEGLEDAGGRDDLSQGKGLRWSH
jgi:hypothetical protein